jgi:23S rRNA pseudouridine1911/1915/1917 synthase
MPELGRFGLVQYSRYMQEEQVNGFKTGERLDKALASRYPQYSRSALEKLILEGYVTVNGDIKRSSYKIKTGDDVSVDISLFTRPIESIEIPIIYEDNDVVVIDKPTGVLTHAKGTLHNEATVATWLKKHAESTITNQSNNEDFWASNRAGIVHRLDRVTSGVMICAKNEPAQVHLQKQFSNRKAKKTYVALIEGSLDEPKGTIDVPIERNPKKPATFRPGINGKSAQTTYSVLKSDDAYTTLELSPHTGRTHQLRVHLQYMKHPIIGDVLYGGKSANRLYLHAKSLEITLPNKKRLTFDSELPKEFNNPL